MKAALFEQIRTCHVTFGVSGGCPAACAEMVLFLPGFHLLQDTEDHEKEPGMKESANDTPGRTLLRFLFLALRFRLAIANHTGMY